MSAPACSVRRQAKLPSVLSRTPLLALRAACRMLAYRIASTTTSTPMSSTATAWPFCPPMSTRAQRMKTAVKARQNRSGAMPVDGVASNLFEMKRHGYEDQSCQGSRAAADRDEVVVPLRGLGHLLTTSCSLTADDNVARGRAFDVRS